MHLLHNTFRTHSVNIETIFDCDLNEYEAQNTSSECPGRDLNPYSTFVEGGFKPPASASFATRAGCVRSHSETG